MKGVIACGDPQTAQAGVEMFSQGGNAVDAAVAATFTSFIAEAVLVNIGGGGIATVFDSRSGTATTYDFFSTMPSGSMSARADFRKIMVDFGPEQQPFYIGRASVSVPGVVAGLGALAAEHGKLSLAQILAPAIRIARQGAVLSDALAYILEILAPIFSDTPRLAARFMHAGRVYQAGERLRFPELAETLAELGRVGPGLFYTGTVAQAIVADQQAHGGLLTAADLAGYRVHKRAPVRVGYRGYEVLLPPPSSSGGVLIAFALKLLESIDLSGTAPGSFEHIRTLAEVMRLTNVARKTWDGKLAPTMNFKDYTQPKRALTTRDYDDRIAQFLSATHIDTYRHRLRAILNGAAPPGQPNFAPGPASTTHISVVDAEGLLVSITNSAGENAGFIVGDTGVCLNNMLGEIDLHPNGFHKLPPAARLTTMMSPVVVLRDGQPVLAVGSGGSNRLRTAITQVISNVIDFGLPLAQAIDAPRVHFEDNILQIEGGIIAGVVQALQRAGYRVNHWPGHNLFFGGAHAVARQNGKLVAAGDARRGGSVAVA